MSVRPCGREDARKDADPIQKWSGRWPRGFNKTNPLISRFDWNAVAVCCFVAARLCPNTLGRVRRTGYAAGAAALIASCTLRYQRVRSERPFCGRFPLGARKLPRAVLLCSANIRSGTNGRRCGTVAELVHDRRVIALARIVLRLLADLAFLACALSTKTSAIGRSGEPLPAGSQVSRLPGFRGPARA